MKTASLTKKERTRNSILEAAARLFRKHGVDGVGVDSIMKRAGLTVGGFYAHFTSKEELVHNAIEEAIKESARRLKVAAQASPQDPIAGMLSLYLSEEHRDHPSSGCVLVALAADLARRSSEVAGTIEKYLQRWVQFYEGAGRSRDEALREISMAVGALALSRMVRGHAISDEILAAGRRQPTRRQS